MSNSWITWLSNRKFYNQLCIFALFANYFHRTAMFFRNNIITQTQRHRPSDLNQCLRPWVWWWKRVGKFWVKSVRECRCRCRKQKKSPNRYGGPAQRGSFYLVYIAFLQLLFWQKKLPLWTVRRAGRGGAWLWNALFIKFNNTRPISCGTTLILGRLGSAISS